MSLFNRFNKGKGLPHIEIKVPQGYNPNKFKSIPEHPKNKSGVCFVVGAHPNLYNDIDDAEKFYPDADICVLNDVASLIPADYLATCHPEKLDQFLEDQPEIKEIHTRARQVDHDVRKNEFVWDIKTGGGSALFAVNVMLALGYEKVILCGCPMDGGGGYALKKHEGNIEDPRFGELTQEHSLVQGWHGQLKRFKDQNPLSDRVRSMSGKTKKIFGGIDD